MASHNIDELDALLNEVEEAVKPAASSSSASYKTYASAQQGASSGGLSDYQRGRTPPSANSHSYFSSAGGGRGTQSKHFSCSSGGGFRRPVMDYKENTPPSTPPGEGFDTPTPRGSYPANSFDVDDIDDLLGMTDNLSTKTDPRSEAALRWSKGPVNTLRFNEKEGSSGKDFKPGGMVLLGGTACTLGGEPSKFRRVINDHLLCLKCMCEVVRFENMAWESDVAYIFFRNYWPEGEKLASKMRKVEGSAAYCCQCSWTSVSNVKEIARGDESLKWKTPT